MARRKPGEKRAAQVAQMGYQAWKRNQRVKVSGGAMFSKAAS